MIQHDNKFFTASHIFSNSYSDRSRRKLPSKRKNFPPNISALTALPQTPFADVSLLLTQCSPKNLESRQNTDDKSVKIYDGEPSSNVTVGCEYWRAGVKKPKSLFIYYQRNRWTATGPYIKLSFVLSAVRLYITSWADSKDVLRYSMLQSDFVINHDGKLLTWWLHRGNFLFGECTFGCNSIVWIAIHAVGHLATPCVVNASGAAARGRRQHCYWQKSAIQILRSASRITRHNPSIYTADVRSSRMEGRAVWYDTVDTVNLPQWRFIRRQLRIW